MDNFIDDVYLYYLIDCNLIEKQGKLYGKPNATKNQKPIGIVTVKADIGKYSYSVFLQPGVLYGGTYIWFYKPNKRAAAKAFREQLIDDIRHQQDKIKYIWEAYDTLESYIK